MAGYLSVSLSLLNVLQHSPSRPFCHILGQKRPLKTPPHQGKEPSGIIRMAHLSGHHPFCTRLV